jgi:NADH dehydrogenase
VSRRLVAYGFDRIVPERDLKLVLIEAAERLVPAVSERISQIAERELRRIGVEVHTGTLVTRVTREGVETKAGVCIPARFTVWTAGIKAPRFLSTLGLQTNRGGQLVVRPTLQSAADDAVFAIGDCAACPSGVGTAILPPTAQAAHQQALLLARSLTGLVRKGKHLEAFHFVNLGGFVSLGGHTATGALMGNLLGKVAATLIIEGWLARFTYRLLYRKHQWAIHGGVRTVLMILTDWATRRGRARLKLH